MNGVQSQINYLNAHSDVSYALDNHDHNQFFKPNSHSNFFPELVGVRHTVREDNAGANIKLLVDRLEEFRYAGIPEDMIEKENEIFLADVGTTAG